MKIAVKNMVCDRCKLVVAQVLDELGIPYGQIGLGEVELSGELSPEQSVELRQKLEALGFEWLEEKNTILTERIRTTVINYIHYAPEQDKPLLSQYLQQQLGRDYGTLSAVFVTQKGLTIEQYAIQQRIERAKELLLYGELNLNEISWKLGYSSVQHLSAQFKKITGLTPSAFRKQGTGSRKPLDRV